MLLIIGFIIVLAATIGGFMMAGGEPLVLLHLSEFVVIGGIAMGILVISSPWSTLIGVVNKLKTALSGKGIGKEDFLDLLKLLYEIFIVARRNGLIALEDHMLDPKNSILFQKYPSFLNEQSRVDFLTNGMKPLIDGRIKPEQLEGLLQSELESKEAEAEAPVSILALIGDSLPGVGIVAAVLGIINTMAAIAQGPATVGKNVAAALTGTFLGILSAYGFVNPLANRIRINNATEMQYFTAILKGLTGFANGMAPIMAVEVARRCLEARIQPGADDLEAILKTLNAHQPKP
ncbi:MAG: MotA/TolQ/ExbB proton channel family protein [Chthoniobacteraceae bacterium]|nr:MotA/TolQ/ExbB proton channel family protein [Chthoniobacteraceae bacterium]